MLYGSSQAQGLGTTPALTHQKPYTAFSPRLVQRRGFAAEKRAFECRPGGTTRCQGKRRLGAHQADSPRRFRRCSFAERVDPRATCTAQLTRKRRRHEIPFKTKNCSCEAVGMIQNHKKTSLARRLRRDPPTSRGSAFCAASTTLLLMCRSQAGRIPLCQRRHVTRRFRRPMGDSR